MKKTIQTIVLAALCLFLSSAARAQTKPLKIGDQVPDIIINNIINYKSSSAKLSDFKGKLLILDFWATWCSTCIPSLNSLDSLKQEFGEDLVVLPVSRQQATTVKPLVEKWGWKLPFATADTTLAKLFPHRSLPHQIWIRDGKLMSVTAHFSATASNIKAALNDKALELRGKNDRLDFDPTKPLMYKGNGGSPDRLDYQSVITGYMDGLGHTSRFSKGIIQLSNNSVLHLYRKALEVKHKWIRYNNRIKMDLPFSLMERINPPGNLHGESKALWYRENAYCYNLFMPAVTPEIRMAEWMYADLNRVFPLSLGISAEVEQVKVKCLVLKSLPGFEGITSRGGEKIYKKTDSLILIRNRPFRMFADVLAFEYQNLQMPLINEVEFNGASDIQIKAPLTELPAVKNELKKHGLYLAEEERLIEMLVFRLFDPQHSATTNSSSVLPKFNSEK